MHNDIPQESRLTSRVILINEHQQVLYLLATEPHSKRQFWVMPGGGLEGDETFAQAAVREAYEETGCTIELGPYVWYRRHQHSWNGKPFDQYERYFVAKTTKALYAPAKQDGYISHHKWWSLAELQAARDDFAPGAIGTLIAPILQGIYPKVPFDCGI